VREGSWKRGEEEKGSEGGQERAKEMGEGRMGKRNGRKNY